MQVCQNADFFFVFLIGNSKDAQVAVQQTHMYITCKFTVGSSMPIESLAEARLKSGKFGFSSAVIVVVVGR